jgi:hypothetical protein
MDDNVKRAEKAIRLVVRYSIYLLFPFQSLFSFLFSLFFSSDKEQVSAFCTRINSALNVSERRGLENIEQLITQLDALVQLPSNFEQKKCPPEMILCQVMHFLFLYFQIDLFLFIDNGSRFSCFIKSS